MSDEKAKPNLVVFSSLPNENFGIGAFVFTRGKLILTEVEAEGFRALLETCDPITSSKVTEMPPERFDEIAAANFQPQASRANDSSTDLSPVKVPLGTVPIQAGGGEGGLAALAAAQKPAGV